MSDNASDSSDRNLLQGAIALIATALFLMVGFQSYFLLQAGENLVRIRANQETPVKNGLELQKKVEDLAGRVAALADGGNAGAKSVVDAMARQGIKMAPPGAKGADGAAAPATLPPAN
jgi:hypothetical protein